MRLCGTEIGRTTVDLEIDLTVTRVWGLPGVHVVAGDIAGGGFHSCRACGRACRPLGGVFRAGVDPWFCAGHRDGARNR